MIDVTLLGTSALMPLPDRALSAALLSCQGHSILFDCGEGTQTAARKAGVSLMKTDIIALTHYHGDHIFGLPGLLQTMSSMNRETPLVITGPGDIRGELMPILHLAGHLSFPVRLMPVPEAGLELNSLDRGWPVGAHLTAFSTCHRVCSQGYAFTLSRPGKFLPEKAAALGLPNSLWGLLQRGQTVEYSGTVFLPEQVLGPARRGMKVVFTGDTAYDPKLAESAADADLLICDATYAEAEQEALAREYGHMNFAQAAKLAKKAGAACLWLTHYSQMIREPEGALSNATDIFPNTECGFDGKHLKLEWDR